MYLLKYLKYLLRHKWHVGLCCWQRRLYLAALTHDLSKFLPCEFFPYAHHFYGGGDKRAFDDAWRHHWQHNPHHWEYWAEDYAFDRVSEMPPAYLYEMLADWEGMSRTIGGDTVDWYMKNREQMRLGRWTRQLIEEELRVPPMKWFARFSGKNPPEEPPTAFESS